MRTILTRYKKVLFLVILLISHTAIFSQSIGNSVAMVGVDGKKYTGVITNITNGWYQIKYDDYDALRWFKADQFTLINAGTEQNNLVGKGVNFIGTDGKKYTGIVQEVQGNKSRIKYDGYDFESWLDRNQFSTDVDNSNVPTPIYTTNQSTTQNNQSNETNAGTALQNIYNIGKTKGWASPIIESKYKQFLKDFKEKDLENLRVYLKRATTASAQFFALKSLLAGDNYETVTTFINQLNKHDEAYQQENCLVTNERSIIQQWQYSCSVTLLQTYLADLCPRYAWEVKKSGNYDVVSKDPSYPMAVQQKELLEKYGGVASPRGDVSGRSIGIIEPLRELVTPILGVTFYAQEVNEPLAAIFSKIRSQLDKGINTPLLIGFNGSGDRHFILAMKYKRSANGYSYLIYDPWDGKCDYVTEAAIEQGSLYPLNTSWKISLDYYYPVN